MKARIEQRDLAAAARWSQRNLDTKTPVPALNCLRIQAEDDTLTISGFDIETATSSVLTADVLEAGVTLAPAKLLADIAAALDEGTVDLVADEHQLVVSTTGTRYELPVLDAADYPTLPTVPQAAGDVEAAAFAKAVGHASDAALAQKDAVGAAAALGGVRIAADGTELTVTATNRYLIVQHTIGWAPGGPDSNGVLLLPEPVIEAAARSLADSDTVSLLLSNDNGIGGLTAGTRTLVGRSLTGEFPDVTRFRPNTDAMAGRIDLDPAELAAAAKRTALVNDAEKPVRLRYADGRLHVSAVNGSRTAATSITADGEGDIDGLEIAFNPGFLATALKPIDGTARIWLNTPTRPAYIHPADDSPGYWAVLMPVRLT